MEYLKESGASIHRRRRRRRAAITLTFVGLLMLGTFAYAAAYFQGWVGNRVPTTVASPTCEPATPAQALRTSAVTINVYNATNRDGLAASVAKSLRTQGFKIGKVANDPMGKRIAGVAEVRHGKTGAAGAKLAAASLSGARVVSDQRSDDTVDLVLGNRFTALRVPPKVAPTKVTPAKVTPAKVTPTKAPKPTPAPTSSC